MNDRLLSISARNALVRNERRAWLSGYRVLASASCLGRPDQTH